MGQLAHRCTRTALKTDRNLYTEFGSHYLLAGIIKKFTTADTTRLQFTRVYLDHYVDQHATTLQEAWLTEFYEEIIYLLKES